MKKRIISFVLAVCLLVSMVPSMGVWASATEIDDPYYEKYGITYEQLFTLYPEYLTSEAVEQITDMQIERYIKVLDSYGGSHTFIPAYVTSLREGFGLAFSFNELLAEIGLTKSKEEKLLFESIKLLMNNIQSNNTAMSASAAKVKNGFDLLSDTFDVTTNIGKSKLIEALSKIHTDIKPKEIESIVNKTIKKCENEQIVLKHGINLCHVIISVLELHRIEMESIALLKEYIPERGRVRDALDMLQKDIEKNRVDHIISEFLTQTLVNEICDLLFKAAFNVYYIAAKMCSLLVTEKLYKGASADDIAQTTILSGFVTHIHQAVVGCRLSMRQKLQNSTIGADDITDYEYLYSAYIESIRTTLESALTMAEGHQVQGIKDAIEFCDKIEYEKYIDWCMQKLKGDIDAGIVAPPSSLHGDPNACIVATYPASGTLTVTKENANIMDRPCSVNTDVNAQLIESGALNAKYTVTGSCVNTANNTWYKITTKSGQTGYIYSGNCTYVGTSDATITGLDMPSSLEVGKRYWIKGTISAQNSTILSVSCYVYDANGKQRTGGTANVNGKSYDLYKSDVDTLTEFNILGAGTYTWKITANVDVGNACQEVVLGSGALVISNPTSDMSGSSGDQAKYNQLLLNVNWSLIDQVGRQTPYSYSCSCFALAYARTLLDNTVHYFYEYNQYGNTEYHVNAVWDWGAYASVWPATTNEALQKLYTELCMGKPVIVYVTGRGSEGHYVTVIGFENVTSLDKLSESNFLIIDPVYKDGHIAVNLGGVGYSLKSGGSVYQVVVDVSGANVPFSATPNVSCPHNYNTDEKAATCTTDGIRTKTCTLCNDTITETIPALGHDYQEKLVEATCGSYGYTHRTCSRCDFSEALEPSEEYWSAWSTEKPENLSEKLIRPRTEYKEMTTSAETSLEGWTKAGAASWTEYGDWSDWGITPITGSATTEVETATVWGYYYLLCPNCGAHMHGYGTCWTWADGCGAPTYNTGWREIWSPISWDSANLREFRGTGKYWTDTIDGNRVFQWTDNGHATTGYRSRTKTEIQGFNYYRWTENEIEGAETRTVYSYYTGNLADHSWDNGAITKEPTENTEGEKTFTCTVCGATKKEAIPAKGGTEPSTPSCTNGHGYEERITQKPTKTSSGTLSYICIECGHVETVELPPLTEDSKYQKEVIAPSCTEKGYTIYRWSPVVYIESDFTDATGHTWNGGVVTKEPTASSEGVKTYTCTVCSEVKTESIPRKDHIHNFVNGTCLLCGAVDPNWDYTDLITPIAYRKAGANRFDTAFLVADTMKAQLGVAKFDTVIVASGVSFADALSGSYLAAVKNAPILLSFNDKYNNMAKDYIRENLAPGGTVYILGGTSAVPASMETGLDGFKVKRLAGKDRFGTNLEILKEAGVEDKPILVCTGLSFADSLSASAAEMPILLVWNKLTKDQKTFLENAGDEFYIIGGESAVSCQMEEQLRDYGYVERIGGKNRFETSVRIAEEFFDNPDAVVLAYAWNFPDGLCGGALAAAMDAPLILTMDKYESQAAKYVFEKTLPRRFVLGSGELISDDAIRTIFGPATDIR